jgi:capsular polysaccharide biosynthesis protein
MQTPIYESSLKLLVRPSRSDFGQSQAARELLGNYEQWLRSSYRAQDVIDDLQLDMTAGELLSNVEVSSDRLGLVLQLVVKNTNGDLANDIATSWGNQLIQWQQGENDKNRQEDRITVEFQDNPQYYLASPQTKINTAAAFVFGALLGIILIFLLEWIASGVLRRPNDIERILEIPVIGSIPEK